jgi:hypothetical protein
MDADTRLKTTLERLERTLAARVEQAYEDRDRAPEFSTKRGYAAGEAHAYAVAIDEVRQARLDHERRTEAP